MNKELKDTIEPAEPEPNGLTTAETEVGRLTLQELFLELEHLEELPYGKWTWRD